MSSALANRIFTALAERIRTGALAPGARLRQEHVALEFDASQGPVREAFRRMEAGGLLVARPRRGVVVAPMDRASVVEVSDMRLALEPLALRHALPKVTEADLVAARAALKAEERAQGDLIALEEANRTFHRALIAPCAMPRLLRAVDDLHLSASRILLAMWRDLPDWSARSGAGHEAILTAVLEEDVDAACRCLIEHIQGGRDALLAWIDGHGVQARP